MVDRVIRIVLDADDLKRGLTDVKGKMAGVQKETKKTGDSMRALRSIAGGLLAALGVRELVRYADAWTTIGNRIRLVTDGTAEYNAVQDELVALAQRTRSDLGATVELYSRVARSTDVLGVSQREVLDFTEAVNQSLQISGATAAEASAGVIQFAQGLAAGALRGDELRSVLEQMPRLASALAEELGVSIGELRLLGEAGELAGDVVFDAVLRAAPKLQAEFDQVTPTIGQAIQTIQTFGITVIGSFNEAAGVTSGLVDIFKLTDEQTQNVARSVRDMALSFREFVEVATVAVVSFVETVGPRFGQIQAEIVKIIAALTRDEALFLAALEGQDEFEAELDVIKARLDAEFEAIRRNNEERRKQFEDRDADLDVKGERDSKPNAAEIKAAEDLAKAQEKLLEGLRTQEEALALAESSGIELADAMLQIKINTLAVGEAGEAFRFDAEETAAEIRRLTMEMQANEDAEKARQDRLAEAQEVIENARTEQEKFNDEVARLQGLLDEGLISQQDFDRSVENLKNFDNELDDFFRRARENSQDILAGFLESGLQDIDDFAASFANMLLQLASQALAANIFSSLFGAADGGGGGGIIGGIISAIGGSRQFGGGVQAGQPVAAAEGGRFGREIFVPNQGGQVQPIGGDRAEAAAPMVNVPVSIVNTIDPSDITGAFQSGDGDQVLLNRMGIKRNAFRNALGL